MIGGLLCEGAGEDAMKAYNVVVGSVVDIFSCPPVVPTPPWDSWSHFEMCQSEVRTTSAESQPWFPNQGLFRATPLRSREASLLAFWDSLSHK